MSFEMRTRAKKKHNLQQIEYIHTLHAYAQIGLINVKYDLILAMNREQNYGKHSVHRCQLIRTATIDRTQRISKSNFNIWLMMEESWSNSASDQPIWFYWNLQHRKIEIHSTIHQVICRFCMCRWKNQQTQLDDFASPDEHTMNGWNWDTKSKHHLRNDFNLWCIIWSKRG